MTDIKFKLINTDKPNNPIYTNGSLYYAKFPFESNGGSVVINNNGIAYISNLDRVTYSFTVTDKKMNLHPSILDIGLINDTSKPYPIMVTSSDKYIVMNTITSIVINPYIDASILNQHIDIVKSDPILGSYFSLIRNKTGNFEYSEIEKIQHLYRKYKENKNRSYIDEYSKIKEEIIKINKQERYKESGDLLYNFSEKLDAIKLDFIDNDHEKKDLQELLRIFNGKILELSSAFYKRDGLNDKASEVYMESLRTIGAIE